MARYLRRIQAQGLVMLLLFGLLMPIIVATLLALVGQATGCQMVGETVDLCQVRGINVGQTIKTLVDWTWNIPTLGLFQFPFLGIAGLIGLLVLIHKSFRGGWRAFVGFFSVWYLGFAPLIVGIIFVSYFAHQANCSLNEGGVGSCYLFGIDMGSTFHAAATVPWLIFILGPFCCLVSLIYVGIALGALKQR